MISWHGLTIIGLIRLGFQSLQFLYLQKRFIFTLKNLRLCSEFLLSEKLL